MLFASAASTEHIVPSRLSLCHHLPSLLTAPDSSLSMSTLLIPWEDLNASHKEHFRAAIETQDDADGNDCYHYDLDFFPHTNVLKVSSKAA